MGDSEQLFGRLGGSRMFSDSCNLLYRVPICCALYITQDAAA